MRQIWTPTAPLKAPKRVGRALALAALTLAALKLAASDALAQTQPPPLTPAAICISTKHDYEHALIDYDQAIKSDAKYAAALNARCLTKAILGKPQEALSDCEQSLKWQPNDAYALDSRAFCHLKLGDTDAAIAGFTRRSRSSPSLRTRSTAAASPSGRKATSTAPIATSRPPKRSGPISPINSRATGLRPRIDFLFARRWIA